MPTLATAEYFFFVFFMRIWEVQYGISLCILYLIMAVVEIMCHEMRAFSQGEGVEIDLKSWQEQELNEQEQEWEQVGVKTHSCRRLHHIFGLHRVNFLAGMRRHNLFERKMQ